MFGVVFFSTQIFYNFFFFCSREHTVTRVMFFRRLYYCTHARPVAADDENRRWTGKTQSRIHADTRLLLRIIRSNGNGKRVKTIKKKPTKFRNPEQKYSIMIIILPDEKIILQYYPGGFIIFFFSRPTCLLPKFFGLLLLPILFRTIISQKKKM